jgi:hypothetical protein
MKNETVTLSRELAEQFLAGARQCDREQLRAALAGPAASCENSEVVTAAWLDLSKLDKGSMAYATAMKVNHRQTELVDRAHITRLQAEVERLKDEAGIYRTGYALLKEELTKAQECLKDLGVDWPEVSDMYQSAKDESHEE